MTRIQLACYSLLAAAFVLAGLLLYSAGGPVLPEAHGEMVLSKGNLTFLTARSASDEEALFVLDNRSQRLLIYTTDLRGRRGRIEPQLNQSLQQMFGIGDTGAERTGGR